MSKKNLAVTVASEKGYFIDGIGVLWYKGRIVKGWVNTNGYKQTSIRSFEGKMLYLVFHKLQAFQKFKEKTFEDKVQVRHLDGNKINNSWDNIEIGSQSDNKMDVPRKDRVRVAIIAASYQVKYDADDIRADRLKGMKYTDIMKKYGISSKGTVSHIINKRKIMKPRSRSITE